MQSRNIWIRLSKQKYFPKEVTKQNIQELIKLGRQIDESKPELFRRAPRRRFRILLFTGEIGLGAFLEIIAIFTWVLVIGFLTFLGIQFVVSEEIRVYWIYFILLSVAFVIAILFIKLYVFTRRKIIPRLVDGVLSKFRIILPSLEYDIFSHSCAIAENILNEERTLAQDISYVFTRDLVRYIHMNTYLSDVDFPETKIINDSTAVERMILFSEKQEIPLLFINIGLAIIHRNFPKLYSLIEEFDYELDHWKVERSKGKVKSFLDFFERYPKVSWLIFVVILIILWLIGVIPRIPIPTS